MNLPFKPKKQGGAGAAAAPGAQPPEAPQPAKKKKSGKKLKRVVAAVLVLALAGAAGVHFLSPKQADAKASFTEEAAARRDITTTLTGTGTLAPLNQYNVTTLARGEVLTCTFEEGDTVQKGDLLYTIDSSDVEDNIEKSRLSLQQSQLSYNQQLESLADLSVKAKKSGVITDVAVEAGDEVKAGDKIADVRDSSVMKLKVPFNSADAQGFYVGQAAAVTIDGSFETLSGTVAEIDGADTVLEGYQMVRNVTISVQNPGALSPSAAGTATVGGVACNSGANFEYNAESTITAEVAGTVASVSVHSGSAVSAGQVVCKMTSTSIQNQVENQALSLKNAELSLQSTIDSLDDYKVTAPISGTVVTKNTQAGDSIDSSSGVSALAVIYDMSALTFDIALDELDVNQVQVGQEVQVTVDALDGQSFTGYITNISVAGTTNNGATTYPVTVQIDDPPAELLPGMNVDASIITGEAKDVLAVPVSAVQRGNVVFVKDSAAGNEKGAAQDAAGAPDTAGEGAGAPGGGKQAGKPGAMAAAPDGYKSVTVETGLANDDYIEIQSGLSEGDVVYVPEVERSNSGGMQMDMMMPAGGGMGGAPGGGGGMGGGPGGGGMP
ncbi:HlyD family efflux transporter periplasmic adaptor subunit [Intestinibacillus massiliensis]|nr:HlyD family efflux transporter periplasmic adaptor subunit [Intestinibacillus massiliensis]